VIKEKIFYAKLSIKKILKPKNIRFLFHLTRKPDTASWIFYYTIYPILLISEDYNWINCCVILFVSRMERCPAAPPSNGKTYLSPLSDSSTALR